MKKYILDTIQNNDYTASSKARKDIISITKKIGFEKKLIHVGKYKKLIVKEVYSINKQLKIILNELEDNSILLVQYPWQTMSYKLSKVIKKTANKKNITTIVLIHDMNSIRTSNLLTRMYYRFTVKETMFLNNFDFIISHNQSMTNYLMENKIDENKIININIFDYLLDENSCRENTICDRSEYRTVNIAGNLSRKKTQYIYELSKVNIKNYIINLYGPFYDGNSSKRINYRGKFSPEKLVMVLNNGFGLVWDGKTLNGCSGNFGRYLKFNNPHKLSLYIACGLPVFVWKDAAVAQFVEKNNIGYVIESLFDIDKILENITFDDYKILKENVKRIQNDVVNGKCTIYALEKALWRLVENE